MKNVTKTTSGIASGFIAIASSLALNSLALNCHAAIVINEIDYDQPGTDTAEFIELFNSGTSTVSLDNYSIELINGSTSTSYRSIDLSGYTIDASDFFVTCGDAGLVANCDYSFTTTSGWFQNGAPDAVALYDGANLIDSLSYEGVLAPYTENSAPTFSDSNSEMGSIARIFDGMDSDNNALDFQASCSTPGTANIAGVGDCSVADVSAVPLPAAAWLFGSGLVGMVGLARRKALIS